MENKLVINRLVLLLVLVIGLLAFLSGYILSSSTGVEPGFFEAIETGSYGSTSTTTETDGITLEDQEYYRKLMEQ